MSNGDLILKPAFACKWIQAACQDSTGMRLTQNATAFQSPAQLTTTGTEPDVLANAIQRNALPVLTGRKNGANAETYHSTAVLWSTMMTGDTNVSACQIQLNQPISLQKTTTGTKLIALGLLSPNHAQQAFSTTTKTKFAVAMNNLALLATTSMLTQTFAPADASQVFAQKTTTGMTKLATVNVHQR